MLKISLTMSVMMSLVMSVMVSLTMTLMVLLAISLMSLTTLLTASALNEAITGAIQIDVLTFSVAVVV